MKRYHGLQQQLAILSTYQEWGICWLKDSENIMRAKTEEEVGKAEPLQDSESAKIVNLYCSKIYQRTDTQLIEVLASVIYKMYTAKRADVKILNSTIRSESRKYGKINIELNNFQWQALPPDIKFSYQLFKKQTILYYLIQDYHGGADGRVWLVVNGKGKLAVMKLTKGQGYIDESKRWNAIWDCDTFTKTKVFGNSNAILMPFAFHAYCEKNRVTFRGLNHWKTDHGTIDEILINPEVDVKFDNNQVNSYFNNPKQVAKEAIQVMANKGWIHSDLHWRHVALLPYYDLTNKIWKVRPILIDLTRCEKIKNVADINTVVEDSMNILNDELIKSIV